MLRIERRTRAYRRQSSHASITTGLSLSNTTRSPEKSDDDVLPYSPRDEPSVTRAAAVTVVERVHGPPCRKRSVPTTHRVRYVLAYLSVNVRYTEWLEVCAKNRVLSCTADACLGVGSRCLHSYACNGWKNRHTAVGTDGKHGRSVSERGVLSRHRASRGRGNRSPLGEGVNVPLRNVVPHEGTLHHFWKRAIPTEHRAVSAASPSRRRCTRARRASRGVPAE